MRTDTSGLQFILGDHLGSASVMADPSGTLLSSQGYMPWGISSMNGIWYVDTDRRVLGNFRGAVAERKLYLPVILR